MHEEFDSLEELLGRYFRGETSKEEEELILDWYQALGKERRQLLLSEEEQELLGWQLWQKIKSRVSMSARDSNENPSPPLIEPPKAQHMRVQKANLRVQKSKWLRKAAYLAGAAAVLIGGLILVRSLKTDTPGWDRPYNEKIMSSKVEEPLKESMVHRSTNNTNETLLVVLQDESMIWLQPNASIHYESFASNSRREVFLNGEAFFEIAKDPAKPFLVHSGNITTKVVGTKFNIRALGDDQRVEVEVTEGTVEILKNSATGADSAHLRLNARQKAVYHGNDRKIEKIAGINNRLRTITAVNSSVNFEFSDTPLRKVVDLLQKAYPVSIELENVAMGNCPLTASLNNESLNTKLELICKSIGASYQRRAGKITLSGEACIQ